MTQGKTNTFPSMSLTYKNINVAFMLETRFAFEKIYPFMIVRETLPAKSMLLEKYGKFLLVPIKIPKLYGLDKQMENFILGMTIHQYMTLLS